MLFAEAADQFLQYLASIERSKETVRGYRSHYSAFVDYCERQYNGPLYLEDVTTEDIEQYLTHLKINRKYSPASRSHVLISIRSLYNYATKRQLAAHNVAGIIEPIRRQRRERAYLTEEQFYELLAQIDHPLVKLVSQFLFMTGLRISECLSLTMDTVDLERKRVHVIAGKGNKDRMVPISDKLGALLTHYVQHERPSVNSNLFFITEQTGQLSRGYFNQKLNKAAQQLGWKHPVTAHILRHSFASSLIRRGAGIVEVQKLLGHASLAVTSIYAHSSFDDMAKAVNRL